MSMISGVKWCPHTSASGGVAHAGSSIHAPPKQAGKNSAGSIAQKCPEHHPGTGFQSLRMANRGFHPWSEAGSRLSIVNKESFCRAKKTIVIASFACAD